MSIAISGTPSRPSFLVANAASLGISASAYYGPVRCAGFDTALIEAVIDQTATIAFAVSGADTAPATPAGLRDYRGASNINLGGASLAAGNVGEAFMVNVGAAQWFWVRVTNGAVGAATVTLRVTFANSGRGA